MTGNKNSTPLGEHFYKAWLSYGEWETKEAALLIAGKDPDQYPRWILKDTPEELAEAAQIRRYFKKHRPQIWGTAQPEIFLMNAYPYYKDSMPPPLALEAEAWLCKLCLNHEEELINICNPRARQMAYELAESLDMRGNHKKPEEQRNTFKLLGILAAMYASRSENDKLNTNPFHPTMEHLWDEIDFFMDAHGIDTEGVGKTTTKNKIKEALREVRDCIELTSSCACICREL